MFPYVHRAPNQTRRPYQRNVVGDHRVGGVVELEQIDERATQRRQNVVQRNIETRARRDQRQMAQQLNCVEFRL